MRRAFAVLALVVWHPSPISLAIPGEAVADGMLGTRGPRRFLSPDVTHGGVKPGDVVSVRTYKAAASTVGLPNMLFNPKRCLPSHPISLRICSHQ